MSEQISARWCSPRALVAGRFDFGLRYACFSAKIEATGRSEEHTSELQSRQYLVCRLLLDTSLSLTYLLSLHDALPIFQVPILKQLYEWEAEYLAVELDRALDVGTDQRQMVQPARAGRRSLRFWFEIRLLQRQNRSDRQIGRAHV